MQMNFEEFESLIADEPEKSLKTPVSLNKTNISTSEWQPVLARTAQSQRCPSKGNTRPVNNKRMTQATNLPSNAQRRLEYSNISTQSPVRSTRPVQQIVCRRVNTPGESASRRSQPPNASLQQSKVSTSSGQSPLPSGLVMHAEAVDIYDGSTGNVPKRIVRYYAAPPDATTSTTKYRLSRSISGTLTYVRPRTN